VSLGRDLAPKIDRGTDALRGILGLFGRDDPAALEPMELMRPQRPASIAPTAARYLRLGPRSMVQLDTRVGPVFTRSVTYRELRSDQIAMRARTANTAARPRIRPTVTPWLFGASTPAPLTPVTPAAVAAAAGDCIGCK
jgi:hypothetical protein